MGFLGFLFTIVMTGVFLGFSAAQYDEKNYIEFGITITIGLILLATCISNYII